MSDTVIDYDQQAVLIAVRDLTFAVAKHATEAGIEDVTAYRVFFELTANLLTAVFVHPDPALIEQVVNKAKAQALDIAERARAEADMDTAAKITGWGQA